MGTFAGQYEIQPWDRQPDENPHAFIAFSAYRDLGSKRTIRGAYQSAYPGAVKMSGTWFNWSRQFKWGERAAAFDAWQVQNTQTVRAEIQATEAYRIAENAQVHKDNECGLAELAFRKAAEILAIPLVRNSFVEQRGGKLIIHKPTLLAPSHLFAAAALMRAASDLGRRGLGIKTEDGETITPDQFRRLFYKHTGEVAPDMPIGALPAPLPNIAEKPDIKLPDADAGATTNAEVAGLPQHGNGNGNGNGNGSALAVEAAPTPARTVVDRYKPPRDRP